MNTHTTPSASNALTFLNAVMMQQQKKQQQQNHHQHHHDNRDVNNATTAIIKRRVSARSWVLTQSTQFSPCVCLQFRQGNRTD